jgi:hypothetical protein
MVHNAVWLGWNSQIAGDDTTKRGMPASYTMTISDSLRRAWQVDAGATLVFSLAPTDAKPASRPLPKDSTKKADSSAKKTKPPKKPAAKKAVPDSTPMDLTVEVTDARGGVSRVALSAYGAVRRPLESYIYLRQGRDKQRFANLYELVLQTYTIPLQDLARVGNVDPTQITSVRFLFDRTTAGTVVVDNIGFSRMSPDFSVAGGPAGRPQ